MPTLQTSYAETRELTLGLALILFDRFSRRSRLVGLYDDPAEELEDQRLARVAGGATGLTRHTTVRVAGSDLVPYRKAPDATFLFVDLAAGSHTIEVRSPFYLARDIPIVLPMPNPRWPAFPDVTLADEDLPLDSPTQPAAYRVQRELATLQPAVGYPFPAGSTLVRGTVRAGGSPLAGARVHRVGQTPEYVTGPDGQYVLSFPDIQGLGQAITLEATHPLHASVSAIVTCIRGMSVIANIVMA